MKKRGRGTWNRGPWMREVALRYRRAKIGRDPDVEVASKLGVTRQAVVIARKRMGIPAPPPDRARRRLGVARRYLAAGIGKRLDRDVAASLGVTRQAVAMFRRAIGIESVGGVGGNRRKAPSRLRPDRRLRAEGRAHRARGPAPDGVRDRLRGPQSPPGDRRPCTDPVPPVSLGVTRP